MRRALHLLIALVLTLPGASQAQGRGPRTATFLHFNDVYEIGAIDGGKMLTFTRKVLLSQLDLGSYRPQVDDEMYFESSMWGVVGVAFVGGLFTLIVTR